VDDHSKFSSDDTDALNRLVKDVLDNISEFDKKSLQDSFADGNESEQESASKVAGTGVGHLEKILNIGVVPPKKKWETIIKRWAQFRIRPRDVDTEQWARIARRFNNVCGKLFLPSEMEVEDKGVKEAKLTVVFFLDTSGSCAHLAERFFKAAKSLPKHRFEVKLFCFDTKVYETTLESQTVYGFGGTSFSILETKAVELCGGDYSKYPKAVFVITDGWGDEIHPKFPKNWYWFLSENHRRYIPFDCNIYELKDYE
jgi:hypothetical protein